MSEGSGSQNRRKTKHYLLEPDIQLKYGFYFSLSALIFALALGSVLYFKMKDVLDLVVELTDVPAVTAELVQTRLVEFFKWAVGMLAAFTSLCFIAGIYYTHRLVGPMVAFRRHIRSLREGNYTHRTQLRESDNFVGFAEELNALSEHMSGKGK